MLLSHAIVQVADADRSLRFYRDGLGLQVMLDREFEGPWPDVFGVRSTRLRALVVGDPDHPESGMIELQSHAAAVPPGPAPTAPVTGMVMLAFYVDDVDAVLATLGELGGTDARRSVLKNGVAIGTVRDPDGVMVELLGTGKAPTGQ